MYNVHAYTVVGFVLISNQMEVRKCLVHNVSPETWLQSSIEQSTSENTQQGSSLERRDGWK